KTISGLEKRKEALQRELESIDTELQTHKCIYAQILNDEAPIYRLPHELLTDILITCQEHSRLSSRRVSGSVPFQVAASHVSHRWREIVLGTPLLWNTIDFRVRPTNHVQRRIFSLLEAQLTRSGNCFLDITLDFHVVDGLAPYLTLLGLHSERWRRLSIITRYEQVGDIRVFLQDAKTPVLEHLSLSLGKPQDGSLSPRQRYHDVLPSILPLATERLKFVRLAGLALGNHHPPLTFVTTLHLDGWTRNYMTHDQFQHILLSATSLINLSLNQLCIHFPRDPMDIIRPINLPNLLRLRIRGSCSPISRPLSLMNMPNLQSLFLQCVDTFDSNIVSSSVQTLALEACSFDDAEIGLLLRAFPNVTSLSIDDSVPDIFSMLRPGETESDPWPRLDTLTVRDLLVVDVPPFCDMVFTLGENKRGLEKVLLDRRSRTSLRKRHRLDWLQDIVTVENSDNPEPWPLGLGYEDTHDLLE
ncbi:hypothetical protein CPC08DRAFT_600570, partial [Agrocybe pediades]